MYNSSPILRIIISPAKKMNIVEEGPFPLTRPKFLERAIVLRKILMEMSPEELKKLWSCNEKIARLNYERLHTLDLEHHLTAALLSYEGIQYQYLAPQVFSTAQWDYVTEHLRILSGFYGILKPCDGVIPYRLEMQARLVTSAGKNLYDFWGASLFEALIQDIPEDAPVHILNLASAEYSKAVLPHLKSQAAPPMHTASAAPSRTGSQKNISCFSCIFGEWINGKIKTKGTLAKMARGEMVRWMAEKQIRQVDDIRNFNRLNYHFSEELSNRENLVFLHNTVPQNTEAEF